MRLMMPSRVVTTMLDRHDYCAVVINDDDYDDSTMPI